MQYEFMKKLAPRTHMISQNSKLIICLKRQLKGFMGSNLYCN